MLTARDIVILRLYLVEATTQRFQDALSALRDLLGAEMPSITTVSVTALFTSELLVEIGMVARVP